jgi:hypothetical protein
MRTALYRHWNAEGELLYVGISLSAVERLSAHAREAGWAGLIAHVTVEWFDTRLEAMAAEKRAILDERPKHNTAHNLDVRSGRVRAGGRRAPPAVPMLVDRPEAVAVYFNVGLDTVRRMIREGMPRQHVAGRTYRYDIAQIALWLRERSEADRLRKAEIAAAKAEDDRVQMQAAMEAAVRSIGRKVQ